MHKQKPNKGLKKRVTVSARGKVRYKRMGSNHLMSGKSGDQVRRLRKRAGVKGKLNANYLVSLGMDHLNPNVSRNRKERTDAQS
jgi:large subunit ribosomal protein L35